jgi:hypothetical protein
MHPTVRAARVAGVWYVLLVAAGLVGFVYAGSLVVSGDAAATAHNILASETLYRVSIVVVVAGAVVWIFLVRSLDSLLGGINRGQASLMVTFVLVSVPLLLLQALCELAALMFMHGGSFLSAFNQSQLDALSMACIQFSGRVTDVNTVFFGLWLLPLGALVYASGFIPRIFGVLLIIDCFAYLAISLVALLNVPPPYSTVINDILILPQQAGELAFVAWLLIKGANVQAAEASAA